MHPEPRSPEEAQRVRAWWATLLMVALTAVAELAYVFIDRHVHPGQPLLPTLRAGHVVLCLALLAVLLLRRQAGTALCSGLFTAALLPHFYIFARAEEAMLASGHTWVPMTGHKLVVLAIGLLAPGGLFPGGALIVAFTLEGVLLWYELGLGKRLDMPWEPWVTLVFGCVGGAMLAWRARAWRVEQRLWQARMEARTLEEVARLLLAVRDAANTPLQTLEVGTTLLRRRLPGDTPVLDSMERALHRLRELTQRMASADPLLVWREGEESFDAEAVLRGLQRSLEREAERRRK